MLKNFSKIDKKYTITFVLAVIFGSISIYTGLFYERIPIIEYQIISNTNVLDVHAELGKLEIYYDRQNIKKNYENLRIFTIKVQNVGKKGVLQSDYAYHDLLGIRFTNGTIIEKPEIIATSSQYLNKSLILSLQDSNRIVQFPKIIFDPDEYFIIKILILHEAMLTPSISATGKIAGVKPPKIKVSDNGHSEKPFIINIISGYFNSVGNFFKYTLGFIIAFGFLMLPFFLISESLRKKKRERLSDKFLSSTTKKSKYSDEILEIYKETSLSYLENILATINQSDALKKLSPLIYNSSVIDTGLFSKLEYKNNKTGPPNFLKVQLIEYLVDNKFIKVSIDGYSIHQERKQVLENLIGFLTSRAN